MKSAVWNRWLLAMGLMAGSSGASTWFVSTTGSDAAAGTQGAPFATVTRAQTAAAAGDTVWIRGGTYAITKPTNTCGGSQTATVNAFVLSKSGTPGNPIRYWAYPGETPVFDFIGIKDDCRVKGFNVTGNWIHMKGLEIKHVPQNNNQNHESWGVWVSGSFNVFEQLNMHHNMGPGLFIQKGAGNLGLNCDSHHNFDSLTSNGAGQSADGFGAHVSKGDTGNVFRGCRAWMNTDDGFDLINAFEAVTIDHCVAAYSGYRPGTLTSLSAGNGNGFKAGGYGADATALPANAPRHKVQFSLAFNCKAAGLYANHHPTSPYFYNNTTYGNHPNVNMLGLKADGTTAGTDITVGVYRNNLAYNGTTLSNNTLNAADDANNSWTLPVTITAADFASTDTAGVFGPRKADGSLPDAAFMHLAQGSDAIGAGTDIGFGAKPDLGAFPYAGSSGILSAPQGMGHFLTAAGVRGGLDITTTLDEPSPLRIDVADLAGRVERFSIRAPAGLHTQRLHLASGSPGIRAVHVEGTLASRNTTVVVP